MAEPPTPKKTATNVSVQRRNQPGLDPSRMCLLEKMKMVERLDELLEKILIALPAKSLIKFTIVSKRWETLIKDPVLAKANFDFHKHGNDPSSISFIMRNCTKELYLVNHIRKTIHPYNINVPDVKEIVHSAHGLLLLDVDITTRRHLRYCVYNPTTKASKMIQLDERRIRGVYAAYLEVNAEESDKYFVNFVVDVATRPVTCNLEVYDPKTNRFRRTLMPDVYQCRRRDAVYLNDKVYWFDRQTLLPDEIRTMFYMRVAEDRESVAFTNLPDLPLALLRHGRNPVRKFQIFLSRGLLYCGVFLLKKNYVSITILELHSDDSGWVIRERLELEGHLHKQLERYSGRNRRSFDSSLRIMDFIRGEPALLLLYAFDKIVEYKLSGETATCDVLFSSRIDRPLLFSIHPACFPFVESLISV